MLYQFVRSALFQLDPEAAHELTLSLLAKTQNTPLACLLSENQVNDPVTIAGLKFPNRIGLAAGLDKNAQCIDAFFSFGFGFVEVGTVTPLAQEGNDKPRIFRLPKANAIINRMGFNNQGLEQFLTNVKKSVLRSGKDNCTGNLVLGLNIGKNAVTPIEQANNDYLIGLAGVYPCADYVTVNISSPNTKNLRSLQQEDALNDLLHALSDKRKVLAEIHGFYRPIFIKIAPDLNLEEVGAIAYLLKAHGMDGVIATNTTLTRAGVEGMRHANEAGGLSGAPVAKASNRVITELRQALGKDFPIIGVGGIMSGQDAVEKIEAGADLVQIYTGFIYKGPKLVMEISHALKAHGAKQF